MKYRYFTSAGSVLKEKTGNKQKLNFFVHEDGIPGRGMSSDEDFLPAARPVPVHRCLLDVMYIHLNSLDLSGMRCC
jgi:hypothetical protein